MTAHYQILIAGDCSAPQRRELESHLQTFVNPYGFVIGKDLTLVDVKTWARKDLSCAVCLYFGSSNVKGDDVSWLSESNVPTVPVVDAIDRVHEKIPVPLLSLNCYALNDGGTEKLASLALECLRLLPRQRRVFLSYKRSEAREAALQIHDALAAKVFDVFLDTHGIPPAVEFQETLWHRLCDSDVLIMLDTPGYFDSRWTSAEFGRALAKGISVLRVGWPDCTPSRRTETASRVELVEEDLELTTGRLKEEAIGRIISSLERLRSESMSARLINMISTVKSQVTRIGGRVSGLGPNNFVLVELADGRELAVCAKVSVPTSLDLHEASLRSTKPRSAVVYDHVGLSKSHLQHMDWISQHIKNPAWIRACEVAWRFADWED